MINPGEDLSRWRREDGTYKLGTLASDLMHYVDKRPVNNGHHTYTPLAQQVSELMEAALQQGRAEKALKSTGGKPPGSFDRNEERARVEGPVSAMTILALVMAERQKQLSKGFDAAHDDQHTHAELINAAISYANFASLNEPARRRWITEGTWPLGTPWPWSHRWWKPEPTARGDLIKACALLIAEVERIDRLNEALR